MRVQWPDITAETDSGPRTAADTGSGSGPSLSRHIGGYKATDCGLGRAEEISDRGEETETRGQWPAVSVRPAPGALLRHDI